MLNRRVLGIPRDDVPEMADSTVKNRVLSKIDVLRTEADRSRIRVETATTATEAAALLAAA